MASFSSSPPLSTTLPCGSAMGNRTYALHFHGSLSSRDGSMFGGKRLYTNIQMARPAKRLSPLPSCFNNKISCSIAQPETVQAVQGIIAKQLSVEESTVLPDTKFADLGADSLDTVEIMMALEEKFGVSIGEGGAENISTVQDAADLIEKIRAN